ncbi:hypothetical protein GCM10018954_061880 [Kutzneria kofuensis]
MDPVMRKSDPMAGSAALMTARLLTSRMSAPAITSRASHWDRVGADDETSTLLSDWVVKGYS